MILLVAILGVVFFFFMRERKEARHIEERLMEASQLLSREDSLDLLITQSSRVRSVENVHVQSQGTFRKEGEAIDLSFVTTMDEFDEEGPIVEEWDYQFDGEDEFARGTIQGKDLGEEWVEVEWYEEDQSYLWKAQETEEALYIPDFSQYLEILADDYLDEVEIDEGVGGTEFTIEIEGDREESHWRERYERFSVFSQHAAIFHLEEFGEGSPRDLHYQLTLYLNDETNQLSFITIVVYVGEDLVERTNVDFNYGEE